MEQKLYEEIYGNYPGKMGETTEFKKISRRRQSDLGAKAVGELEEVVGEEQGRVEWQHWRGRW